MVILGISLGFYRVYVGIMEKNMENVYRGYMGFIQGFIGVV